MSITVARHFAWLTPAAPAAIAVLQCSAAAELIDRPLPDIGRARFAVLIDAERHAVDEVVVIRHSTEQLELQCHGGVGIRAAIEKALTGLGFQAAPAQVDPEWRAYAQIAHSAALPLLSQHLKAGLDLSTAHPLWFRQPVILLTGPSNAGKSTLMNTWCGHNRAIVSDRPGTTRDLLAAVTELHGWRLQLLDSAGLRAGADNLELAGQALVKQARTWVDLVIYLDPDGSEESRRQGGAQPEDLLLRSKWDLVGQEATDINVTKALVWSAAEYSDVETAARSLQLLGEAALDRLGLAWTLPSAEA